MMRLILGTGKVSTIIQNDDDVVISREECDIANFGRLEKVFLNFRPDVVINTAAKTNLEYCEAHKRISYNTNTLGPINLLHLCEAYNAKLIHISSGCLFDGNDKIADETSIPNTSVWYTHIKKWADEYIENYGYDNYLILRPRQMISATSHPTNMLTKFSNYEKIYAHREPNSITCVEDFKEMLEHLIAQDSRGTFNCCNDGVVTPYEIALGVQEYIKPQLLVEEASYEYTLTLQANRRVNTILSNEKLKSTGYHPRTAKEALKWTLQNYE